MESAALSYDTFRKVCPSHAILELLSNKWLFLTVVALRDGPQRFSQLERRLSQVSAEMLTQTLRLMERDGLVRRRVVEVMPPHVDYDLTPLGQEMSDLMRVICEWGEAHVPSVTRARAEWDERAG